MSAIQKLELASQVEIKKPLHRAVRRHHARLHSRVAYRLFHFRPFLVPSGLRAAQGDGQSLTGYVFRGGMGDHVGRFFRRQRVQRLMFFFRQDEV